MKLLVSKRTSIILSSGIHGHHLAVVLGILINGHKSGRGLLSCGEVNPEASHLVGATRWVLDHFNDATKILNGKPQRSFIPGKKIGKL